MTQTSIVQVLTVVHVERITIVPHSLAVHSLVYDTTHKVRVLSSILVDFILGIFERARWRHCEWLRYCAPGCQ